MNNLSLIGQWIERSFQIGTGVSWVKILLGNQGNFAICVMLGPEGIDISTEQRLT